MYTIGSYLREMRELRGFRTQGELSEYSGIAQGQISKFESDKSAPNLVSLSFLALALRIPYTYIMTPEFLRNRDIEEVNSKYISMENTHLRILEKLKTTYFDIVYEQNNMLRQKLMIIVQYYLGSLGVSMYWQNLEDINSLSHSHGYLDNESFSNKMQDICSSKAIRTFYAIVQEQGTGVIGTLFDQLNNIEEMEIYPQDNNEVCNLEDESADVYVDDVKLTERERKFVLDFVRSQRSNQ